jgi:hypothetical protein
MLMCCRASRALMPLMSQAHALTMITLLLVLS